MDLREKQSSMEQEIVLRMLAESVAYSGCKFLEVGSWLGDSAIILAKVAQEHKGFLFCVDWWKGNIGTDLVNVASKVDIFSVFWSRICKEGLEDTVIPIRSRSDLAANILKGNSFNLIFLDADHRYDAISDDIKRYGPLVNRNKGVFCGHDCEGRISDYETSFLKKGKNIDYYETVHCGVVLAVGEAFKDYSINHSIWSVQFSHKLNAWIPTSVKFKEIPDERQAITSPLGFSKSYLLVRYGKSIYAISRSNNFSNIKKKKDLIKLKYAVANSWQEVEKKIGERVILQLEPYRGYNVIGYGRKFYVLIDSLDSIILVQNNKDIMRKYQNEGSLFIADSIDKAKQIVDGFCDVNELPQHKTPVLIEEGYEGFNIIKFWENFYALAQSLGPVDFSDVNIENLLQGYRDKSKCFVGSSVFEVKHLVDKFYNNALQAHLSDKDKAIEAFKKDISYRDEVIAKLNADVQGHNRKIEALQASISDKDKAIGTFKKDVFHRDENIVKLNAEIQAHSKKIEALQKEIGEKDSVLEGQRKETEGKEASIVKLQTELTGMDESIKALNDEVLQRDISISNLNKKIEMVGVEKIR